MGLFGGGAQKRRIEELEAELQAARAETDAMRKAKVAAEALAAEKDRAVVASERRAQEATETLRKSKQKTDKAATTKGEGERREQALKARVEHLETEVVDFRTAMLEARRDAESAHAARFDLQRELESVRARQSERAAPPPVVTPIVTPTPQRVERPARDHQDDMRMEHLEEELQSVKAGRDELRDRIITAERQVQASERKLKSELGKADSVLRDLRHNLNADRTAYRILQLQFEAIVDRTRGLDQLVDAKVGDVLAARAASAEAAARSTAQAAPAAPAAAPVVMATVLPDAPPVGEGGDA